MKGDYSKIPFDERKKMQHYRKVYLQQGKVLLDSDLNENTDLLHYQMKTLAKDGLCGSPNIGFRIGRGVPLLPVDDHRYIGEGKGWDVNKGTLTIDYFEKFEGKGSLKLEKAAGNTEVSFAFQKPLDLSKYRYLRLALKSTAANPHLTLVRFDGENYTEIELKKQEQSTDQNKFSVIKYVFPPDAVLDNITKVNLTGFNSNTTYNIGAVECSPPMFTLEPMTHLQGWSFDTDTAESASISIDGEVIKALQVTRLYKKHFSTVDFSKFETLEFAIKSDSKSTIQFYVSDENEKTSYWDIEINQIDELKKYSIEILQKGNDADLASIKEYGFKELSDEYTYHFGSILYGMSLKNNFVISGADPLSGETGRLYVDGELYEKEEAETYLNQKDCPSAPSITQDERTYIVYVDVWQRHVTSAEDPELREVAVGVDTCNRMKAVAQVKVRPGETSMPDLKPMGGGKLSTAVEYMEAEKLCEITPGVEYTGLENRLYRVEIHTPGTVGSAAYKWSRNNASTVTQIIENVKEDATSVKLKDVKLFEIGDIIEITDDRFEFADRKYNSKKSSIKPRGELRRITSIDRNKNELAWANTSEASDDPLSMAGGLPHDCTAEGVETTHPRVIKWDGAKETSNEETLEDGIKIRFSGSDMLPGDYWTFTARENTRAVERLDNEPPQGVVHRYYPLAVIEWGENGEIINIADLRTRFEPLCGLTAADLAFDNANTPIWTDAENVQQALERITFPKASGIMLENNCEFLYGKNVNNMQAALDNLCNGITVPSLTLKGKDAEQSKWPKLKCSDSGDISFLTGAKALEERVRISADGNIGIGRSESHAKLHVHGPIFQQGLGGVIGNVTDGGKKAYELNKLDSNAYLSLYDASANLFVKLNTKGDSYFMGGNVGIGTIPHEIYKLDVRGYNMLTDPGSNYNSHFPYKNNCAYITGSKVYIRGGKPDGWKKCLTVDGASGWTRIGDGSSTSTNNIQFEPQDGFHRVAFNELRFWDWDAGGDMVTFKDGNVGIGTPSPQRKLHISGDGGILNSVTIGANPDPEIYKNFSHKYPYETIGVNNPGHNLRLTSANAIVFHPGGSDPNTGIDANRQVIIDSGGNINVSGKIKSPKWKVTSVIRMKVGGLPVSGEFESGGGTLLIFAFGSGYASRQGEIGIHIRLDEMVFGKALIYANETFSHKAFIASPMFAPYVQKGSHTIDISPFNLNTKTDVNDRFDVTVLELPI